MTSTVIAEPGTWLEKFQQAVADNGPGCPANAAIGASLTFIEPGRARIDYEFSADHTNPPGVLHGGILTLLADSAMGMAFMATLGPGENGTNTGLHMEFLRPTSGGRLTAKGHTVQAGRTMSLMEATIQDEKGRLVAKGSSRFVRLPSQA